MIRRKDVRRPRNGNGSRHERRSAGVWREIPDGRARHAVSARQERARGIGADLRRARSPLAVVLKKTKVESVLKLEGHRTTKVQSLDQLSTIIAAGHFDVILTANDVSPNVQRLVAANPKAATVLAVDAIGKDQSLLQVIDKAVAERDQKLKRASARRNSVVRRPIRIARITLVILVAAWPAQAFGQAFTRPAQIGSVTAGWQWVDNTGHFTHRRHLPPERCERDHQRSDRVEYRHHGPVRR